jgi:hypothetical protein
MKSLEDTFSRLRKHNSFYKIISATQVSSIMGFNQYQNDRELFRVKRRRTGPVKDEKTSSKATEHGLKFEPKAIDHFLERHQLERGFVPPYLTTQETPTLGGRGDYIYSDKGVFHLLEIKCLYSREITRQIPIGYWLQIQTMLYVYQQLGLPIERAVYCENRFSVDSGKLLEYWEETVVLDESYFVGTVVPSLKIFFQLLNKKRPRDEEDDYRFINRKRRRNNRIVSRVNHSNLYEHFLVSSQIHNAHCLKNHLLNDHLVDWMYMFGSVSPAMTRINRCRSDFESWSPLLLKDIYRSSGRKLLNIVNLDEIVYPVGANINHDDQQRFQLVRTIKTVESLKIGSDVIIGAQLYHPELKIWSEYDALIRHQLLSLDVECPNNYLPVKFFPNRFATTSSNYRTTKMELYQNLSVLNFYFSSPNFIGAIVDQKGDLFWVDYRKESSFPRLFSEGHEWLSRLSKEGKDWSIDPPAQIKLYPNQKLKNHNFQVKTLKDQLAKKNEELTQLWSLSVKQRNALAESSLAIKSISELKRHIDEDIVRETLGPRFAIIRNIIESEGGQQIVNCDRLKDFLNKLPRVNEIFLDFEFNDEFVYMIGYVIRFCDGSHRFQQFVIKHLNSEEEKELIGAFRRHLRDLLVGSAKIVCFHWGQVERTIIGKKCSDLLEVLEFVDLNQLMVQYQIGIPSCYGYGLKSVAKALKRLNLLETDWKENSDGYWCNNRLSTIYCKGSGRTLSECQGFQEMSEYNQTDCQVLFDIVTLFRETL